MKRTLITYALLLAAILALAPVFGEENSNSNLPKFIDFGAKKCKACKMLEPVIEELKNEYSNVLSVEFVDVWLTQNEAKASANGIESIPTQIFFSPDNKELWRHTGFISKKDIIKKWKELGFDLAVAQENPENTNATETSSLEPVSENGNTPPLCRKGCQD